MCKSVRLTSGLSLVVAACATALLAACSGSATAPQAQRASPTASAAQHDIPPDSTCLSGWINVDGRWVCG